MASIRHVEAATDYRRERGRQHDDERARERPHAHRRPASPPAGVPVLDARTEWVGAPMPRRHAMQDDGDEDTPAGRLDMGDDYEGDDVESGLSGDDEDADPQADGSAQTPSEAGTEEEEEVVRAEATLRAMRADADRAAMLSSMVAVSRTTNPGGALAEAAAAARRQAAAGGAGRGGRDLGAAGAAAGGDDEDEEGDVPEQQLEEGEWVDSDTEAPDSASEADPAESGARREGGHRREQSVAAEQELAYIRHVLERTVGQPRLSKACDRLARLDLAEGFEAARLALGREHEHLLPLVQRLVVGGQARGTA